MKETLFTVIIPTFNAVEYISDAIASVERQTYKDYEMIVVDDCSTDETYYAIQTGGYNGKIRLYQTPCNSGPGIARNIGLEHAKGEYIIFLDSDDMLSDNLLEKLAEIIENKGNFDICDYNFTWNGAQSPEGTRKDMQYLLLDDKEYLKKVLKLHTDCQVIYTCYRKKFLDDNRLRFRGGVHEDVAFFYKTYRYARKRCVIDFIGYIKTNRKGSIVNTVSEKHIIGFYEAWEDIKNLIEEDDMSAWKDGVVAIGAVKIRDILRAELLMDKKQALYMLIEKYIRKNIPIFEVGERFQTKYYKLVSTLLCETEKGNVDVAAMEEQMREIMFGSWSCWDLQHSLFLASDEVRVCCKRFFTADGKAKGDVVLTEIYENTDEKKLPDIIQMKKKQLKCSINAGEINECSGCPYLVYKDWESDFSVKKISFEQHSICNLRCVYCSPKYYGGKKEIYDINCLVAEMNKRGMLKECKSIVWGGGEPVLSPKFSTLFPMALKSMPKSVHNVISNATVYSDVLAEALLTGRVNLITSIDAGTRETYGKVRGKDFSDSVWKNLSCYALKASDRMIIKYIVMEENSSLEELKAFARKIVEYGLCGCSFQISCNFKKSRLSYGEKLGVIALYGLLLEEGVKIIFFDELLRERLHISMAERELIKEFLETNKIKNPIYEGSSSIVIWGSENQIINLLQNTLYFSVYNPCGIISNNPGNEGKKCCGFVYESPSTFVGKNVKILISAVQGTRAIYEEFCKAGFDESRRVKELVI